MGTMEAIQSKPNHLVVAPWSGDYWAGKKFDCVGALLFDFLSGQCGQELLPEIAVSLQSKGTEPTQRDLLPFALPTPPVEGCDLCVANVVSRGISCWVFLILTVLNAGYRVVAFPPNNCRDPEAAPNSRSGGLQEKTILEIQAQVEYFVNLSDGRVISRDWAKYLQQKHITYTGEVEAKAVPLTWRQMQPGLPPKEFCGKINAIELCEGAVKEMLLDPQLSLLAEDDIESIPLVGRCHIVPGEECLIARELLSCGLLEPIEMDEVPVIKGRLIVNGTFGVGKGKFLPDDAGRDGCGLEVLRWILNLTVSNSIMVDFPGDIAKQPIATQWKNRQLQPDEAIVRSFDDLRGCFYLFRFPPGWSRWLFLNLCVKRSDLGLTGSGSVFLGCTVCPMGFKNAMGIVQYLHRRLLLLGTGGPPSLPPDRELRRDRPLAFLRREVENLSCLWQIFCDDFDVLEVVTLGWIEDMVKGSTECCSPELQTLARRAYQVWGIPISNDAGKSGIRELFGTRLGIYFDARAGRLGGSGHRFGALLGFTGHLLDLPFVTLKHLQVCGGHWTHVMQMRKETSSFLSAYWREMALLKGCFCRPLTVTVKRELIRCMILVPLMNANLRLQPSRIITASDASEFAHGGCMTNSLVPEGCRFGTSGTGYGHGSQARYHGS